MPAVASTSCLHNKSCAAFRRQFATARSPPRLVAVSAQLEPCNQPDLIVSRRTLAASIALLPLFTAQRAVAVLVEESISVPLFQNARESVVSVVAYKKSTGQEEFEGVGTGFVWDKYGHVVTNYHCVQKLAKDTSGSQVARVSFTHGDGRVETYDAYIVAADAQSDLAVLEVDVPQDLLKPISVGTSADLRVGQYVYAIGNPYGLTQTLSVGVIGGLNRSMPSPVGTRIYGVIQTDAQVNQGNSGGPLLDSFGRLVGVCTASFTRKDSGRGSGVNFALPVDLVTSVVPRLIVYKNASGKGV